MSLVARASNSRDACGQAGVSMIEVLVALVVLSIGLLGVAALQLSGMQGNYVSYQYMQAADLAQSIAERMRANRGAVLDGRYGLAAGASVASPTVNCASAFCNSAQQAVWDLAVWHSAISGQVYPAMPNAPKAVLPHARASLVCVDTACIEGSVRLITVYWDSARRGAVGRGYGCDPVNDNDYQCFRLPFVP